MLISRSQNKIFDFLLSFKPDCAALNISEQMYIKISTYARKVMVGQSVCPSDYLKKRERIYMKLPPEVCFGPRNNQLHFGYLTLSRPSFFLDFKTKMLTQCKYSDIF